ncbi:MAG: tRNA dihydrouridine synthase DusB [Halothiobacillaceae bacterium]
MRIGLYTLDAPLALAPMAGMTDRPFRQLCKSFGAGLTVGEMSASDPRLRNTRKSLLRRPHVDEPEPRAIQLVGNDPALMADAARLGVDQGAQIIDINMGCPAKKVCQKAAGAALLGDLELVGRILDAVVRAVDVPVTLKIRTGLDAERRNAVAVARIAEAAGIQALAIHGRTRADRFHGAAEYDTIRAVRDAVGLPLWANGDIDSPAKALEVLRYTGADGVMIGRAALGRPWLFAQLRAALEGRPIPAEPDMNERLNLMLHHLDGLYELYGVHQGARVARKHIGWYCTDLPGGDTLRSRFITIDDAEAQRAVLIQHVAGYSSHPKEAA